MFPANGPKKPAAVTMPKINRCRPRFNAEYGGLGIGLEVSCGELAALSFGGMRFSGTTSAKVLGVEIVAAIGTMNSTLLWQN